MRNFAPISAPTKAARKIPSVSCMANALSKVLSMSDGRGPAGIRIQARLERMVRAGRVSRLTIDDSQLTVCARDLAREAGAA